METTGKVPEQTNLTRQARGLDRKTLSPLGKLTLVGLLGYSLTAFIVFFRVLLVVGLFVPPIIVVAVVTGLAAGAVAARWRPAPLLGAIVLLISLVPMLTSPVTIYDLTHPAQFLAFILVVLALAFALVAIVAGVGTTVQNYRGARR